MFRRIVSNLAFSPALVGQLGFYARRLRKEETTRRLGLIFTALALVVQSLAVFSPPEAANAASSADFIRGGVSSKQDFLGHYDRNTNNVKDIFTSLGITRAEIANTTKTEIREPGHYNWSLTSLYSHAQGQRSWDYGKGTAFYRPMTLTQQGGPVHTVFSGYSATFGWFAIKKDCGNLVTKTPPRAPNPKAICENLAVRKLAPTRFRVTAKSSTQDGASIQGYVFSIAHAGKTETKRIDTKQTTADYEYTNVNPGTYRASVVVKSSVGNVTSPDCKTTFDVNTDATCEQLTVVANGSGRYKMTGRASTKGGVEVRKYVYTVKNTTGKVIDTKSFATNVKQHEFVYAQATPGTYQVILVVHTSIGEQKSSDCRASFSVPVPPKPIAACTNLKATIANRTTVSLTGSATVSNGATIKSYTFTVKNSAGATVKTATVTSSQSTVNAPSFELASAGNYTAELVVATSLGNVTNADNCREQFTITKADVCAYNPSLPPNSPDCQPCEGNPDIWVKDERCDADVISTKTGVNLTRGNIDATTTTARAGDKLSYTLTVENKGMASEVVTMSENLVDVLEYATLVDQGGGNFDQATKVLSWPAITVGAGQKQSRTIAVHVMDQIPSTNTGTSNADSYDCKMVNTFGNSVAVNVDCAPEKVIVEQVVSELPTTGPRENMIFAAVLLAVVVYFYARSRQLGTEVRLIRRNLNTGTI